MKKDKAFTRHLILFTFGIVLLACNNSADKTTEEKQTSDTNVAVSEPAAFTPFKIMLIKHTVADYAKWNAAYQSHDSVRKAYGLKEQGLLRETGNSNRVLVELEVEDVQKSKDFTTMPNLKEAMQKAGVTSAPEFSWFEVIRKDNAKIDTKTRLLVTHRVKDFNAWLTVYDQEGKAVRANEGLTDRALARGVDDPNMVLIEFAVTDMEKAKAAIQSEAKKNLMVSAGVEGKPGITFYEKAN